MWVMGDRNWRKREFAEARKNQVDLTGEHQTTRSAE
jgi:hypothetical protein